MNTKKDCCENCSVSSKTFDPRFPCEGWAIDCSCHTDSTKKCEKHGKGTITVLLTSLVPSEHICGPCFEEGKITEVTVSQIKETLYPGEAGEHRFSQGKESSEIEQPHCPDAKEFRGEMYCPHTFQSSFTEKTKHSGYETVSTQNGEDFVYKTLVEFDEKFPDFSDERGAEGILGTREEIEQWLETKLEFARAFALIESQEEAYEQGRRDRENEMREIVNGKKLIEAEMPGSKYTLEWKQRWNRSLDQILGEIMKDC